MKLIFIPFIARIF